ncbi:MAG: hypothetical protein KF689_02445 [Gemmatimonadaceae bacterium]|nr:hypothetical protein [Gemmatimonadaceae bacterium]MCW5826796.1 hypothetical protein [Gemmatimonadaceae bacterium]
MHEILRDRILRRLEALPEDRLYQVLDYVEFLESKYAQRQAPAPNVLQRFAEGVEDTLRAGNLSASTVAEAMGFMSKAMGVLSGVAAAGASMAGDIVGTAQAKPGAPPAAAPPKPTSPEAPPSLDEKDRSGLS